MIHHYMRINYFISFFCFLIISTACARLPSKKIPTEFNSESGNGLITGTISIENKRPYFNAYTVSYKEVGTKNASAIIITPEQIVKFKLIPDFFDENRAVYLFSFEKPVGDYEFFRLGFFVNSGSAMYQRTIESSDFSLPFHSKSGEITYVGEIVIDSKDRTRYQEVNDKFDRDITALIAKFPSIDWSLAQNKTMKENSVFNRRED